MNEEQRMKNTLIKLFANSELTVEESLKVIGHCFAAMVFSEQDELEARDVLHRQDEIADNVGEIMKGAAFRLRSYCKELTRETKTTPEMN